MFNGNLSWGEDVHTISSKFGDFPLKIEPPVLPELPPDFLFESGLLNLPRLPEWNEPVQPKGWSLFSSPEGLYQEGLSLFSQKEWLNSLEEFEEIIDDHKESLFYQASLFWKSQILIKIGKEKVALEILQQLVSTQHSKYLFQSAHTLIWLTLKQKEYSKAIQDIEQFSNNIFTPVYLKEILPLKAFAYFQQNRLPEALEALIKMQAQFPNDPNHLENSIQMAELYFRLEQCEKAYPLIKEFQDKLNNPFQLERLLFIGVSCDLYLQDWKSAQHQLNSIEERGITNENAVYKGNFYLNLWQNQPEKAWFWIEQFKDANLKKESLRRLYHYGLKQQWLEFLTNTIPEQSFLTGWETEIYPILGHAYELLGQINHAYEQYQKALFHSDSQVMKEQMMFHLVVLELKTLNYNKAVQRLKKMFVDFLESTNKSEYFFWYGLAQGELGSPYAILAFNQIKPDSERADDKLYYLERLYHSQQNWDKTGQVFSQLLSQYPQSPFLVWAYYYRAEGLFSVKEYKRAKKILEEWEQNHKDSQMPLQMVELWARTLKELQLLDEANHLLGEALQKLPNFSLVRLRVQILNQLKKYKETIQLISASLNFTLTEKEKKYLYLSRAEAAFSLHERQAARDYYLEVLENNDGEDVRYIYHQLAQLAYDLKDNQEFETMGFKVLDGEIIDNLSNNILILFSNYHAQQNDKKQEMVYLDRLMSNYDFELKNAKLSETAKSELLYKYAKIKNRLGMYKEADIMLDQAAVLDNQEIQFDILKEKGFGAFHTKNYEKAAAVYLKLVYLKKELPPQEKFDFLKKIAYSYREMKQFKEAWAIYQKMLRDFDDKKMRKEIKKLLKQLKQQ
ncbi:MAG: hypothetical protein HQM14_02205 [SAR324 cluster bacterium]|nr:hypothetical protein [SAR324 cluster bacterium]